MTLEKEELNHPRGWTRGGVHYFRIKVPVDLREHYKKIEIKKSLGTKDARQAKKLINKLSVRYDAEFDSLRRRSQAPVAILAGWTEDLHELERIDDRLIELVTTSWLRESLEFDEIFRTDPNGLGEFEREDRNQQADEHRLTLQTALATGQTGLVDEFVLAYRWAINAVRRGSEASIVKMDICAIGIATDIRLCTRQPSCSPDPRGWHQHFQAPPLGMRRPTQPMNSQRHGHA